MATVTSEVVWLLALLKTFGLDHKQPASLYSDSKAALYIAANPVFHEQNLLFAFYFILYFHFMIYDLLNMIYCIVLTLYFATRI